MSASYAMRGKHEARRVSEDTLSRVLDVARELDYRPDARGRALRLQRTNVIGIYAGLTWIDIRNPFFAELVSGVQEGCHALNKNLLLHSFPSSSVADEVFQELNDGRVDGLVVVLPLNDPLATRLSGANLPVVALADAVPGLASVVVNDAAGARAIADHLLERGHRKVIFASGANLPTSARRRQESFVERSAAVGMEVLVIPMDERVDVRDLVGRATAIVAWNDIEARQILQACRSAGIAVPKEVSITGFDGCPTIIQYPMPLTTVRAPWSEVGREAVNVLNRMLRNEPYDLETVMPVELVRGVTT